MLIFTVDKELVRIRSKKCPPNWWSWSTCSGHKSPPEMPPCSCNLSFLADNLKNTITPIPFYMPFFLRSRMHGVEVLEECSFLSLFFRVLMLWWVFNISSESPALPFFQLQTKALFCMWVFLGDGCVCVCVFCTSIQNTHTYITCLVSLSVFLCWYKADKVVIAWAGNEKGPFGLVEIEGRFPWKNWVLAFLYEKLIVKIGPVGPFTVYIQKSWKDS